LETAVSLYKPFPLYISMQKKIPRSNSVKVSFCNHALQKLSLHIN